MAASSIPSQPNNGGSPEQHNLTLEPLRTEGQAALAPDVAAGIVSIVLSEIVVFWRNAFNEVTIRQADDLFACAARDGRYYDIIPKGAHLARATLDVQFAESPVPRAVKIVPPHTLIFQSPSDAPRIVALLARRGFKTAQTIALALLLTAACAPDPGFDGDDDDGSERGGDCRAFAV